MSSKGCPPKVAACGRTARHFSRSRRPRNASTLGLLNSPNWVVAEPQLAADDAGWAQARDSQGAVLQWRRRTKVVVSPGSGRTESRLCFRVAQATYADTPNDDTAITTPQIAMTVFASTKTSMQVGSPIQGRACCAISAARRRSLIPTSGHWERRRTRRQVAGRPGKWVLAAGTLAACRLSLLPSSVVSSRLAGHRSS